MGRRSHREAGRCFDRLRRDLAAREPWPAEEQIRLAALDREREAAVGRLLRDLGARDRFERHDAAAPGRLVESARLWRQRDASRRGAGRVIRCRNGPATDALPSPARASGRAA